MRPTHWMYEWFDHHGVRDSADLRRAAGRQGALRELIELAEAASEQPVEIRRAEYATVAGVGIDLGLSHDFGCLSEPARHLQVEQLLRSVCHYFDQVILDDSLGHNLVEHRAVGADALMDAAVSFGVSLLHLRDVGATDFVAFVPKRHLDEERAPIVLGPDEFHALLERFVPQLLDEATIWIEKRRGHGSHYVLQHDGIPNRTTDAIPRALRKAPKRELRKAAADSVLQHQMWWLTRDLLTAIEHGTSLTIATSLQAQVLAELRGLRNVADVTLNVHLPILAGVAPQDVLRLRRDESVAFDRFRRALTTAIATAAKDPSSTLDLQRDVVEPELDALSQRLKTAERAFAKKAAYGVSLGVVTAICGLTVGTAGLVTTGVAAAIAAAYTAQSKLVDERRDVQLSDMYFVWRALR